MARKTQLKDRVTGEELYPVITKDCIIGDEPVVPYKVGTFDYSELSSFTNSSYRLEGNEAKLAAGATDYYITVTDEGLTFSIKFNINSYILYGGTQALKSGSASLDFLDHAYKLDLTISMKPGVTDITLNSRSVSGGGTN